MRQFHVLISWMLSWEIFIGYSLHYRQPPSGNIGRCLDPTALMKFTFIDCNRKVCTLLLRQRSKRKQGTPSARNITLSGAILFPCRARLYYNNNGSTPPPQPTQTHSHSLPFFPPGARVIQNCLVRLHIHNTFRPQVDFCKQRKNSKFEERAEATGLYCSDRHPLSLDGFIHWH